METWVAVWFSRRDRSTKKGQKKKPVLGMIVDEKLHQLWPEEFPNLRSLFARIWIHSLFFIRPNIWLRRQSILNSFSFFFFHWEFNFEFSFFHKAFHMAFCPLFPFQFLPFNFPKKRCRPNVNSRSAQTPAKPAFERPRRNVWATPFFGKLIYNRSSMDI